MKKIELRYGNLKLVPPANTCDVYHIVHTVVQCEDGNYNDCVYTVAFLQPSKEDCDMRTIGMRPWEMEGTTVQEFMDFCRVAMKLIDSLVKEE